MVKIQTIKKDLEGYFRKKDGKEIPLDARPLEEIKEGIKYTRGPDQRTVDRNISHLREWGIIPTPEKLMKQLLPQVEAKWREKIRSQTINRLNQEKNVKVKSLDHSSENSEKIPSMNPKQKIHTFIIKLLKCCLLKIKTRAFYWPGFLEEEVHLG